jgi:hypothetical protein
MKGSPAVPPAPPVTPLQTKSKWFLRFCWAGFIGSLLVWILPGQLKPYPILHHEKDFKILFEEYTTEFGFARNGLVYAHHENTFLIPGGVDKTGRMLDPIRREWMTADYKSTIPWPVNSNRVQWDEWGVNRWHRPDGLDQAQVGAVFCLPYSILAIAFAVPLVLRGLWLLFSLSRNSGRGQG